MILYQHHNSSVPYNYDAVDYDNFEYIPHLHRDPEIVCVLEGEVTAVIEDRTEIIRKGQFALILPNQVHTFETPVFSKARVIVFSEEYVREFRKSLGEREGKTSSFSMPETDRELFLNRMTLTPPHRMDICACLSLACSAYLKEKEEEGMIPTNGKKGDLMHQMLSFISEHYTENVTLTGMAEALGYEEHYLSRCFHRFFRKNFKQFVNEYRICHARQLMTDPNNRNTLTEIAFASGFQSVRNFNRVYRDLEGCQPRRQKTATTLQKEHL